MAWLPESMDRKPRRLWRAPLGDKGLGGVAANDRFVIVSSRTLNDSLDFWRCLDASSGAEVWAVRYPAKGKLDYGSSPRATALLANDRAFLLGAFGHLHAVELASGRILWKKELATDFPPAREMPWGQCDSPLLVDGKLIVCPGSEKALLLALNPETGEIVWKSPGGPAGYGSFIAAELGGRRQIVGHDATSLGGWDIASGQRLWTISPARKGDFNVPTPVVAEGMLIVATEGNGTRAYRFRPDGTPDPQPAGTCERMNPDTASPVWTGQRLFGLPGGLHCLDVSRGLKPIWVGEDDAFSEHASLIASERRILAITLHAEAILIDATADRFRILARHSLIDDEAGLYSHPAMVGRRLYVRGSDGVYAFELE